MKSGDTPSCVDDATARIKIHAQALRHLLSDQVLGPDNIWRTDQEKRPLLEKVLLSALSEPESVTERLREVHLFLHGPNQLSPIGLLRHAVGGYVVFDGPFVAVSLDRYRHWRTLCSEVDEEVLVAAAMADALANRYPNSSFVCDSPSGLGRDLVKLCLSWPLFLRPFDRDFRKIVSRGLVDRHVHFGELPPAAMIWRELATGQFTLDRHSAPQWLQEFQDQAPVIRAYLEAKCFGDRDRGETDESRLSQPIIEGLLDEISPTPIRRYLLPERIILVFGMYRQVLGIASERETWEYYQRYLAMRIAFMRSIDPKEPGFEAFARTYRTRGAYRQFTRLVPIVLSLLADAEVRSLDVRVVADESSPPNEAPFAESKLRSLRLYASEMQRLRVSGGNIAWNVVVSFSKKRASGTGRGFGYRQDDWRRDRERIVRVVRKLLAQGPHFLSSDDQNHPVMRIIGIDMISSEYGYDVGVVAPAYQLTHPGATPFHESSDWETSCLASHPKWMVRFYHSGEDRDHPVTAARVVWEAIHWLGLTALDRLGHLAFLVDEPSNYSISETAGERLDNLLWLYHLLLTPNATAHDGSQIEPLRREIEDLSFDIHADLNPRPTISELLHAWEQRPLPEQSTAYNLSDPAVQAYLGFAGTEGLQQMQTCTSGDYEIVLRLEEVRNKRAEHLMEKHYRANWWLCAQRALTHLIKERGIHIETCPTSNLAIGSAMKGHVPATDLIALELQPNLLVGSDDPSMFKTDVGVEAGILMNELLSRGVPRFEAYRCLQSVLMGPD